MFSTMTSCHRLFACCNANVHLCEQGSKILRERIQGGQAALLACVYLCSMGHLMETH